MSIALFLQNQAEGPCMPKYGNWSFRAGGVQLTELQRRSNFIPLYNRGSPFAPASNPDTACGAKKHCIPMFSCASGKCGNGNGYRQFIPNGQVPIILPNYT